MAKLCKSLQTRICNVSMMMSAAEWKASFDISSQHWWDVCSLLKSIFNKGNMYKNVLVLTQGALFCSLPHAQRETCSNWATEVLFTRVFYFEIYIYLPWFIYEECSDRVMRYPWIDPEVCVASLWSAEIKIETLKRILLFVESAEKRTVCVVCSRTGDPRDAARAELQQTRRALRASRGTETSLFLCRALHPVVVLAPLGHLASS